MGAALNPVTPAATSSIATRFLVELLDELGAPCDDLLTTAALSRGALAGAELSTPWPVFVALWRRAAALRPDVGLALCERFPEGQMHMITHLALRSETVGAGIEASCRYFGAVSANERMRLEAGGDRAALVYESDAGADEAPWVVEHHYAMATRFLARALGRPLPVTSLELRGPRTAPLAEYTRRFGVRPRFGAARNALAFERECLDWTLPTRDAYLSGILARVAALHAPPAEAPSWSQRVRTQLAQALLAGSVPTIAQSAAACGLGVDALRSRLRADHTAFRALLDDTRRALAQDHLSRGFSATSVAYLLGFSEPAAFQHACRRWFGAAAGTLRKARARSAST